MSLIVQKYGGSSVSTPGKIKRVAKHIKSCRGNGDNIIVVVSAMGNETDRLLALAAKISPNPNGREKDQLVQTGEVVTASLLAIALNDIGVPAISLAADQIGLIATGPYGSAKIKSLQNQTLIKKELTEGKVIIVTGFQGISENGLDIITLGRGGSDTTAVALAAFLKAKVCEIYTDVDGVYAIDPRLVKNARRFPVISYDRMIAMSVAGAGVLMDRAVIVAKMHGVEIKVLVSPSIRESTGGTLVTSTSDIADLEKSDSSSGIAIKKDVSCIHVFDIPNEPGKAAEIFSPLRAVNVIEIAQSQGDQTAQISILLEAGAAEGVFPALGKIGNAKATLHKDLAAISLIDPAMKETPGYLGRLTKTLGNSGINIEIITTSQNSITVAIIAESLKQAALALAKEFDLLSS